MVGIITHGKDGRELSPAVQSAATALWRRMPGCPDPDCYACRSNKDAILDLITTVQEN